MAIYRENPRPRLVLIGGAALAFVGVIVILVLLLRPAPNPTVPGANAAFSAPLAVIAQGLDVYEIEVAKVRAGTPASQTGAPAAIQRALKALTDNRSTLSTLDDEALAQLEKHLNTLADGLKQTPPPDQAATLRDALAQLATLQTALAQFK
jgi:hypothetical protein